VEHKGIAERLESSRLRTSASPIVHLAVPFLAAGGPFRFLGAPRFGRFRFGLFGGFPFFLAPSASAWWTLVAIPFPGAPGGRKASQRT
jgi:hypothetical protein